MSNLDQLNAEAIRLLTTQVALLKSELRDVQSRLATVESDLASAPTPVGSSGSSGSAVGSHQSGAPPLKSKSAIGRTKTTDNSPHFSISVDGSNKTS
jgi:hypothetical protein